MGDQQQQEYIGSFSHAIGRIVGAIASRLTKEEGLRCRRNLPLLETLYALNSLTFLPWP
jgi:hypothetical protein